MGWNLSRTGGKLLPRLVLQFYCGLRLNQWKDKLMPFVSSSGQIKGLPSSIYGTGADGAATISVDTTIDTIKNYTDLTVNVGVVLTLTAPVFVSGILTNNGSIVAKGGNGGNASTFNGGTAGVELDSGWWRPGSGGNSGGAGTTTTGSVGAAANQLEDQIGGAGGTGGNGGAGASGAGGAGGANGGSIRIWQVASPFFLMAGFTGFSTEGIGGAGGGVGGGGGGG